MLAAQTSVSVVGWCRSRVDRCLSFRSTEGFLTSCSFDYLTDTDHIRVFVAVMFVVCYCIPMSAIIYFYSQIVSHVVAHEKALKAQVRGEQCAGECKP